MYSKTTVIAGIIALWLFSTTSFADASLGQAFLLMEKEDYLGAAKLFYELKSTESSDAARDEAEMGLAKALSKAKLPLSALHANEAIVSRGASHRYFVEALMGLIESANDVGGELLISQLLDKTYGQNLEALAKLDPKSLQHLHFMLSKRAFRAGRTEESVEFANSLRTDHEAFARAQYVMGVIKASDLRLPHDNAFYEEVMKLFDSASHAGRELRELAQLAKARVYYERGMNAQPASTEQKQFLEKSIQFYRAIPIASPLFQKALFEKAWAHTALKQADLALGALYALNHPKFERTLDPDAEVLEAINYLSLCDYRHADEAIKRLQKRFGSKEVEGVTLQITNSDRQAKLFQRLIDQIDAENLRVQANGIKDTSMGLELQAYLSQAKKELDRASESWRKQSLAQRQAKIEKALTKAKLISVEVSSKEAQLLASGINTNRETAKPAFKVVPPSGVEKWVLTGQEMWSDELSDLRVWTVQKCL